MMIARARSPINQRVCEATAIQTPCGGRCRRKTVPTQNGQSWVCNMHDVPWATRGKSVCEIFQKYFN